MLNLVARVVARQRQRRSKQMAGGGIHLERFLECLQRLVQHRRSGKQSRYRIDCRLRSLLSGAPPALCRAELSLPAQLVSLHNLRILSILESEPHRLQVQPDLLPVVTHLLKPDDQRLAKGIVRPSARK